MSHLNDRFQPYYTNSEPIVNYMVDRLQLEGGEKVLEPCAGRGVFIKAIRESTDDLYIHGYELDPKAYNALKKDFSSRDDIEIFNQDTLFELGNHNGKGEYERIISNPPYGAWQDYERREKLKKKYPNLYVKETYTLFLYKAIQLLKSGGRLVFIVPNTFLHLHRHTKLRQEVLAKTAVEEISIFPSSFFPDVNYGYAKMCIVTLVKTEKRSDSFGNTIKVYSGLKELDDLNKIRVGDVDNSDFQFYQLNQKKVYKNPDHALMFHEDPKITKTVARSSLTIGDIADCVTGFYSGNDAKYLKKASKNIKRGGKYEVVKRSQIAENIEKIDDILEGIDSKKHYVPILKGGSKRYLKENKWHMNWSKSAVNEYNNNSKARFQNPNYYFKQGIGVPMVASGPISGALIENRLFDQSIVGVFPHNISLLKYLLAYLNSELCEEFISIINPTANNSANYIKKIPIAIPPKNTLTKVDKITTKILDQIKSKGQYSEKQRDKLNQIFWKIFKGNRRDKRLEKKEKERPALYSQNRDTQKSLF